MTAVNKLALFHSVGMSVRKLTCLKDVQMMNDSSLGIKDMFMLTTVTHSGHRLFSVRILKMAIKRFLLWAKRKEYLFIVGM